MISPLFTVLTIIAATMVITSINPVHSIIWLVMAFIGSSVLFLQLEADFVALTVLIVYVGAIAVLFVFVLMMLNLSVSDIDLNISTVIPITISSIVGLISVIINMDICSNFNNYEDLVYIKELTNIQTIGSELYSFYSHYFILASVVLLVGMIGSILLTLNPSSLTKRQNMFLQINRDFHNIQKNSDNTNN